MVLDGIHNLLKLAGKDLENVTSQIEECGGLDKIESLQNHENVDIYKLAYEIIECHFNDEASDSFFCKCQLISGCNPSESLFETS